MNYRGDKMNPFLSICIPTFNRGPIVYDTVCNILKSDRQDIEVVVSNNCSTDDTEELLKRIKDKRFRYFKNTYNNGADNLISVLTYAQGEYLLLLSDEDDVVLRNLESYIIDLHKLKPAVMFGTSAVNRYRYAYKGNLYMDDCYEALKVLDFEQTYMSGYIYNRKIMKRVLGNLYGTEINRKLGYGYNFLNLARRMVQYGGFLAKEEVITSQRAKGKRDMQTHFDGGNCTYSPEYRVEVFCDAVNDLAQLDLSLKEKYLLLEMYKDQIVINASIQDYMYTYNGKSEYESKRDREYKIAKYYQLNKQNVQGIKFYCRLFSNVRKCNNYLSQVNVFKCRYNLVKLRYLKQTFLITKSRYEKILRFTIKKAILEME